MTYQADDYAAFVQGKVATAQPCGFDPATLAGPLFPHQRALTEWAVRRGRAAIFAATGLGKTRCYLAWADAVARHTGGEVLVLTPLAVAPQGAAEAVLMGLDARVARDGSEVAAPITITNYDRLHRFDPSRFVGVVLDESSCIKHHDTKTLRTLLDSFARTPYRLACTATPAPNDWTELGTHAEFLGVCSRTEMLAEFFVHDGGSTQDWRLKGHARDAFWRWVSSWGALVRSPADLGYDASGYDLPPLSVEQHTLASDHVSERAAGMLFAMPAQSLSERRSARRGSIDARASQCVRDIFASWKESEDGLEAGARKAASGEGSGGPCVSSEAERSISDRSDRAGAVHEAVRGGAPGEVSQNTGAVCQAERQEAGDVCDQSRDPRQGARGNKGVAAEEPGETQGAETEKVRANARGVRIDAGSAGGRVRNLRSRGQKHSELLPGGGSLPQDGGGARSSLHELQHGAREVRGQSAAAVSSQRVSREPWCIWCELNSEQDALEAAFGDLAFSVRGSDTSEDKEESIARWLRGERPVMISKPSIMGWGLNFQHCARTAFVGVTDSWEAYHQAVRRFYRFGQTRPVQVHVYSSELEGSVVANLARKERDATALADALSAETLASVQAAVLGSRRDVNPYEPKAPLRVPAWLRTRSEAA